MNSIEIALELLQEGRTTRIGDVGLGLGPEGLFEVSGWSNYHMVRFLTKRIVLQELSEVKVLFEKMLIEIPELKDIIGNRPIRYQLLLDDSGKFSALLLSETNTELEWYATLND